MAQSFLLNVWLKNKKQDSEGLEFVPEDLNESLLYSTNISI